jgi:hypothetical protein
MDGRHVAQVTFLQPSGCCPASDVTTGVVGNLRIDP